MQSSSDFPPTIPIRMYVQQVAFSSHGWLAVIGDGELYRIDPGAKAASPIACDPAPRSGLAFDRECGRLAYGFERGVVILDPDGKRERVLESGIAASVADVALSRDGRTVAATTGWNGFSGEMPLLTWSADGGKARVVARESQRSGFRAALQFSADGKYLVTLRAGVLERWNLGSKRLEAGPRDPALELDATRIAVADDGTIAALCGFFWLLYDGTGDRVLSHESSGDYELEALTITADGRRVITGCQKTLSIHDSRTGRVVRKIERKRRTQVRALAIRPDGWLAIATDGGVELQHLDGPAAAEPKPDLAIVSTGPEWRIRGPRGTSMLRFVQLSSEAEAESRHPRVAAVIEAQHEGKWVQLLYAYAHGSYDDEDRLVLEDSQLKKHALAALAKRLGTTLDVLQVTAFIARSSPWPEGFGLVVDTLIRT